MSTDRELLELAAKAAGYTVLEGEYEDGGLLCHDGNRPIRFSPLVDDGDALRLAVKCGIEVCPDLEVSCTVTAFMVGSSGRNICEQFGPLRDGSRDDPMAATRRAITRSAAEIGKAMP